MPSHKPGTDTKAERKRKRAFIGTHKPGTERRKRIGPHKFGTKLKRKPLVAKKTKKP